MNREDEHGRPDPPTRRVRWRERLGFTADVLQLAGWIGVPTLAVLAGLVWGATGENEPESAPTKDSPASSSTARPATSSSSVTSSGAAPGRTALLSDLPRASSVGSSSDLRFRDVEINGDRHENSLHHRCELYCDGPSPATYEVVLGREFSRFTALAGVVDTAARETRTKFEIDVDGKLHTFTAELGKPQAVDIDVRGALRLTVRIYAPAPLKSPLEAGADIAGGVQSVLPDAALGHPLLVS